MKKTYVIQGNYGHGWEDVVEEDNREDASKRLREYRENEGGPPYYGRFRLKTIYDHTTKDEEQPEPLQRAIALNVLQCDIHRLVELDQQYVVVTRSTLEAWAEEIRSTELYLRGQS